MKPIIALESEMFYDLSQIVSPFVHLLLAAVGEEVARGSPWVSVKKRALAVYPITSELMAATRIEGMWLEREQLGRCEVSHNFSRGITK